MQNLEDIMFYAFRYALGRRTYAVYDVAAFLITNKDVLHKTTKKKIIEEILECEDLGMDIDKQEWFKVIDEVRNEI